MERTKETLEARVRETPLVDRLKECQKRIGNMCAELRGPKMSIPVEYYDDDFYICTTLADAQATVEALQRERDFFETAAATANRMRVDTERALDAEREKVKGLHEITKVICAHCCEPMEIPSKAVLQTQLGRTLPATTPAGQRWRREKPTEPGWYWWRHNACSPVHATYLERGNGCDHDGLWYAKENMCVPHNAAYVPYGEWQGPISPNEATE